MRPVICQNLQSYSKALVALMNTLTFGEQPGQMNPPSPTSSATLLPRAHEPRRRRKTMAYAGADDEAQKLFGYARALSLSNLYSKPQGLCEQSPNKVQRVPSPKPSPKSSLKTNLSSIKVQSNLFFPKSLKLKECFFSIYIKSPCCV